MFIRRLAIISLLGCVALGAALGAAESNALKIVRVFTGWRDAGSFKRISEYFDGKENTGGEVVLRTHGEERGGYYFLTRIGNPGAPVEAKLVLQVVMPGNAVPRNFTFPVSIQTKDTVFNLGLTGADWPDKKVHPVAWKMEITAADGQMLATEKSYLWEKPAG
ncbi:MAG TPA: hypothetical protein VFJ90_07235, partial [Candidatus Didemnitutus sp.]|nr:hypothetical protein [Candidatus Didemnitutus sp.]